MRTALRDFLLECDRDLWVISDRKQQHLADFYAAHLDKETSRVLVAADDADRPVGMLLARILESRNVKPGRFVRIDDAWVEPDHRRRGLMRRLVAAVADYMEESGVEHAMLDYALRNPASEKAWLALGFKPVVSICRSDVATLRRATTN